MKKVVIKPFNLIGISIRTTNENGQAAQEIGELWGRFLAENILEQIPNKVDTTIYSLYTNYEGDHTKPYTTILGCKVTHLDEIPEGLIGKAFEGGDYVKTSTKGNIMEGIVIKKWFEIWAMDMDRKYSADFEVYGEKAQDPTNSEVDFYIAVK